MLTQFQTQHLNAVYARTSVDAWAVGYYNLLGVDNTLIEHWDGANGPGYIVLALGKRINILEGVFASHFW